MAWATRQHITLGVAKVVRGTGASGNIVAWLVKLLCRGYTVPATASDTGSHSIRFVFFSRCNTRAFFLVCYQNKKERKKVREVGILKKDPDAIKDQIEKLEKMKEESDHGRKYDKKAQDHDHLLEKKPQSPRRVQEERNKHNQTSEGSTSQVNDQKELREGCHLGVQKKAEEADGALDKARKHKKRQLEDTYNLVVKKRKEYEEKMKEKGEQPVMFSHLGPPKRRPAADEDDRAKNPMPERPLQQPPLPGTNELLNKQIVGEGASSADSTQAPVVLPPPPPPPRLPPNSNEIQATDDTAMDTPVVKEDAKISRFLPPPPPHPSQLLPLPPRPPMMPPVQPDILSPGMVRFPPPPSQPDSRPPFMAPGVAARPPPPPPALTPAQMPMAPFGVLPGPSAMLRPPFFPGPEFAVFGPRPQLPQQPSYVKSAASTVVKRPLAQHTPELTAMFSNTATEY
ncbi:unnamed protein product [Triticum turgidum subsp. durum]|uniref:Wbp11/ELF5/Saf1 N-terminal domain-containing protein n=1 Tax=Triticum turgidum subsp. durum TaxID=4567 RepID=A0A9R1NSN2_TRITD|nr:unnamed protein product [Triticum turgidum subsp. durum]